MTSPTIFWKPNDPPPPELSESQVLAEGGVFASTAFPRCLAWISTNARTVALVQGYNAVGYTPPVLMVASDILPAEILEELRQTKLCTISAVTAHESTIEALAKAAAAPNAIPSHVLPFEALHLAPFAAPAFEPYPPAVRKSPMRFYCTLDREVPLRGTATMVLLTMETVVVDGSVLRPPTELMKGRDVKAKIDCDLIRPWLGLSKRQFSTLAVPLRSMPRPRRNPNDGTWTSTDLDPNPSEEYDVEHSNFDDMEWAFRRDGRSCPLGYNPVTAIIMPRPIGWISSYHYPDGEHDRTKRVAHLAPYSFFTDVSRDDHNPMVAFSGYRQDGVRPKDAQNDAQRTGCFAYNLVSEPLARSMNFSAAELGRLESEFELSGLAIEPATLIDAPMVRDALIRYECEYVTTVDVGTFSIVVGKVVGVHVSTSLITADGRVDPMQARPITRLGYTNEYGTLP
jgi:flavin reductase (DIM6/NTAB) family NADH-FMN oxidoreductase RutF